MQAITIGPARRRASWPSGAALALASAAGGQDGQGSQGVAARNDGPMDRFGQALPFAWVQAPRRTLSVLADSGGLCAPPQRSGQGGQIARDAKAPPGWAGCGDRCTVRCAADRWPQPHFLGGAGSRRQRGRASGTLAASGNMRRYKIH
ncbi:uncharacterized protein V1510DRAFT_423243 [Dipodascopsis tothii]|uniref:uncharacterized protein n=1 Tax=Dipodascopsis tothii TaxID=44089 RepID=UPI0034CF9FB0